MKRDYFQQKYTFWLIQKFGGKHFKCRPRRLVLRIRHTISLSWAVSDAQKYDSMNKPVLYCEGMGNEAIKKRCDFNFDRKQRSLNSLCRCASSQQSPV